MKEKDQSYLAARQLNHQPPLIRNINCKIWQWATSQVSHLLVMPPLQSQQHSFQMAAASHCHMWISSTVSFLVQIYSNAFITLLPVVSILGPNYREVPQWLAITWLLSWTYMVSQVRTQVYTLVSPADTWPHVVHGSNRLSYSPWLQSVLFA